MSCGSTVVIMSAWSFAKGSERIEEYLFGTLIKISKSTLAFPTTFLFVHRLNGKQE